MSAIHRVPVYNRRGTTTAEELSNPPVLLGHVRVPPPLGRAMIVQGVRLEFGIRMEEVGEVDPYSWAILKRLVFIYEGDPADLKAIPSFTPERDPEEIP